MFLNVFNMFTLKRSTHTHTKELINQTDWSVEIIIVKNVRTIKEKSKEDVGTEEDGCDTLPRAETLPALTAKTTWNRKREIGGDSDNCHQVRWSEWIMTKTHIHQQHKVIESPIKWQSNQSKLIRYPHLMDPKEIRKYSSSKRGTNSSLQTGDEDHSHRIEQGMEMTEEDNGNQSERSVGWADECGGQDVTSACLETSETEHKQIDSNERTDHKQKQYTHTQHCPQDHETGRERVREL